MTTDPSLFNRSLHHLLVELIDGPADQWTWVLNPEDAGLLSVLEGLSAEVASRAPAHGRATIAAHANHVCYGLELLNRWAGGEENPFADADWAGSWRVERVSEPEWRELLARLRREAHGWRDAAAQPRTWDEIALTGALASAAHLAYHLGAIRQLVAAHEAAGAGS